MTSSTSTKPNTGTTGGYLTATDGQTVGFNAFQIREIGKYDVATCAAGFGGAQVQLPGSTVVNVCYASTPTQMPPNTGPSPSPSPSPSPVPVPSPVPNNGSSGATNPRSPWSPFGPSNPVAPSPTPSSGSSSSDAGRTGLAGSSSYSSSYHYSDHSDHGHYSNSGYRSTDHNLKNFHGYYDQYRNGHFRPPY